MLHKCDEDLTWSRGELGSGREEKRNSEGNAQLIPRLPWNFLNGLAYFFHAKNRINVNSTITVDRTKAIPGLRSRVESPFYDFWRKCAR